MTLPMNSEALFAPALVAVPPAVFSSMLRAHDARRAREYGEVQRWADLHEWSYDPFDGTPFPPLCDCH